MEYVQEAITTLHDFGGPALDRVDALIDETAVVVPMTHHERETEAATRVFETLASIDPGAVVVPIRAPATEIGPTSEWLGGFDLAIEPLWCSSPELSTLLADTDIPETSGKGRDVWLALGIAAERGEHVVVHDADAVNYDDRVVRRLLAPLTHDYAFAKGYYARVEDDRLYGRLVRLLIAPLLDALAADADHPLLSYLRAFRYPLAGEFAASADLIERLQPPPGWGLEIATLGDAYEHAGPTGTAQVDLGCHEHDHRPVAGADGLEGMSVEVAAAVTDLLESHGLEIEYDRLRRRFREAGGQLIEQYAADARFNGLEYSRSAERDQLERYVGAIQPPVDHQRLPPWTAVSLKPGAIARAARPAVRRSQY